MLKLLFLGTSAARPTVERSVSALAMVREGETLLFECGEGTQRQMMRYGVSFNLSEVYFSHFHADHFLGVIGLVRTLGLQGRTEPMRLYGPKGARRILGAALGLGVERVPFEVEIEELEPDAALHRDGYEVLTFGADHGGSALGYVLVEKDRLGRFDPERAKELGVPEGPLWGRLQRAEAVTLEAVRALASLSLAVVRGCSCRKVGGCPTCVQIPAEPRRNLDDQHQLPFPEALLHLGFISDRRFFHEIARS